MLAREIPQPRRSAVKDASYYKQLAADYLMPNYGVREIVPVRGEGSRIWDADGREYLDFLSGISVNNLGHCHPAVTEAIREQAAQLVHTSNLYLIPQQAELAKLLCDLSFAERAFFANSGAEVNEGAIKLARLYSKTRHGDGRYEIITLRNSFHGRTMATITATGQEKVQKGYEPLLEGFRYAGLNDLPSVVEQISERTCAVMLEPVQGEGGIVAAEDGFLQALREECTRRGILLIFDEIQCGMGRTGTLFAYEASGVAPDIMTLAKALGNGFPIGALLTRTEIAEVFQPGTHGSTFGGNPLACAVALAVVRYMADNDIPGQTRKMGDFFADQLRSRLDSLPNVKEVRGRGMMIGVELTHPGADVIKRCTAAGLLINCTMGNVLRLLPPLTATAEECGRAAQIIHDAVAEDSHLAGGGPESLTGIPAQAVRN